MPKFEICIIETREHFFEVYAKDESEAASIAEELEPGESLRDTHREQSVEWIQKLPI
jgi:hypothetical protein